MSGIREEEMRYYLDEITELDMTPHCADDYLSNEHYHSFLKGCDCEMIIKEKDGYGKFFDSKNMYVNKYCKTHKVMCSKTGWEIGWYQGTKSETKKELRKSNGIKAEFNRTLTDDEVREIRILFKRGFTVKQIMFRLSKTYWEIYGVVSNSRYREII